MKEKNALYKSAAFLIILSCFLYFAGYTCSWAEGRANIVNMHYERGVKFYKQGKYDIAIKELERVLEIAPTHKKAKKYLSATIKKKNKKIVNQLYMKGRAYFNQREYQKALDAFNMVLEIIPSDGYALYQAELLKAKIEKLERLKK